MGEDGRWLLHFSPFSNKKKIKDFDLPPTHRIGSGFKWWFRQPMSIFSWKAGFPGALWMSRWAELQSAWTPLSVRLEMWNLMGTTGFRFCAAFCNPTWDRTMNRKLKSSLGKNALLLAKYIMPPYCFQRSNREFYCELKRWMGVGLLTSASNIWLLTFCPRIILKRTSNVPHQLKTSI